ncbi:MAG: hypothetical protein GWP06_12365 [Actinobacteria bacterium]|nr:hypothetical protein [Actinomycetota bacterium]
MRTVIAFVSAVIFTSLVACAQTKVPEKVKTAFQTRFPAAKDVEWGKESDTEFEAEFEMNGKEMTANFDVDGKWLETESTLSKDELPAQVLATLRTQFGDYKLTVAEKTEKVGKPTVFEVKLGKDETDMEVVMGENGKVVKKEIKSEEKEKEEKERDEHGEGVEKAETWTKSFDLKQCQFSSTGKNRFFILQPGYQLILEGTEGKDKVKLVISVLDETQKIGDVKTRVVEEREMANGQLIEVSRNFFAIDKKTQDVFYFGEDVDIYKNGKVVGHEGGWKADEKNHAGLMMPGSVLLGARYYQEVAPGIAMDRAEIVDTEAVLQTPAGNFKNCLKTEETTPMEADAQEYKIYAPGIGLIKDGNLLLTKHGFHIL